MDDVMRLARRSRALVSVDWLRERLTQSDVVVVDASWQIPGSGRDARGDYRHGHIPGARFLDLNGLRDPDHPVSDMAPSPGHFARHVSALGIGNDTTVVVYDSVGVFSAPRAWWLFRLFGHNRVSVLDGGLPAWKAAGLPLQSGEPVLEPDVFHATYHPAHLADWRDVLAAVKTGGATLVEGREIDGGTAGNGDVIPTSRIVPWSRLLDTDKRLQPDNVLRAILNASDVGNDRPVVATCGLGIVACQLGLALHMLGRDDWCVYDGSWAEWASRTDLRAETAMP